MRRIILGKTNIYMLKKRSCFFFIDRKDQEGLPGFRVQMNIWDNSCFELLLTGSS